MLGSEMRRARLQAGASLDSLAAELGVSRSYLCDVEHDRRPMTDERIRRAAKFFAADVRPLLIAASVDRGYFALGAECASARWAVAARLVERWAELSDESIEAIARAVG